MNDQPIDQFSEWRKALATGERVDYTRGSPTAGYYKRRARNKDRSIRLDAVAIWTDAGEWLCHVTGGYAPTKADEIEELFVSCNGNPISYELFDAILNGGEWPEEVKAVIEETALSPHEAAAAELKAQQDAAKAWLLDLKDPDGKNRKPETQIEADKAANYGDAFGKIEREAKKKKETEKRPITDAGNAIEAKWRPIIDGASTMKVWAKGLSEEFARRETARRVEEARVENERRQAEFLKAKAIADEQAARDAALAAKGVKVPQFAPPPEPPKAIVAEPVRIGSGSRRQSLRKFDVYEIEDASKLLVFLADRNLKSEGLLNEARKDGQALMELGVEVPGLKKVETEKMV